MRARNRILAVARKELRTLVRDRFYLFMAVVLPLVTMVVMGYGINYDVRNVPLGVADLDGSAESRALVQAFVASGYFRIALSSPRPAAIDDAMAAGRLRVGIIIPDGFGRTLHRGRPAETQILIDGSLPTRADIVRGYTEAIVARFNQNRLEALAQRVPDRPGIVHVDVARRVWFNPNLESKNFLVPGLLVLSLLFWTPTLVSLSVTREKETGAILNVQTVPLAKWEYVAGKLIPYATVSFLAYFLLLAASIVLFRVPVKGSVALLTGGALIYVVSMTGLGLLVSMLVRTQVAALLATAVIVMAVGLFYSGWVDPVSALDAKGRMISRLLPTADLMTMARGVFLKGLGFDAYRGTLAALAAYMAIFVALPVLAFRKRRR